MLSGCRPNRSENPARGIKKLSNLVATVTGVAIPGARWTAPRPAHIPDANNALPSRLGRARAATGHGPVLEDADVTAAAPGPCPSPWPEDAQRLRLADLAIDLRYRRIERPDGSTELPNRMFDLLRVFLARPHVLHTRGALFEQVWSGVVVEDANLSQSIWMLRKALGPERRHWIRTVPGSGYVFEPPGTVEMEASGQARRGGRGWLAAGALALLAGLVIGLAGWPQGRSDVGASSPVVAVALIEVGLQPDGGEAGWPAKLLHAWLAWKLDHLPEALVLDAGDLASDAAAAAPLVVLIASGRSTGVEDELFVRARLASDSGSAGLVFERRGSPEQMPALVTELSRQMLATLLPARAETQWPALELDAGSARAYAKVRAAVETRDWTAVAAGAPQVTRQAPGFGLVRFDLARAQARLGRPAEAQEQMALARRLLAPVPGDARVLMHARELAIDPQAAAAAAEAWAALAREHPQRPSFALEHARQLVRAGSAGQALEILGRPSWEQEPAPVEINRLLVLAEAGLLAGNPAQARASAREAVRLAQITGKGWEMERGSGLSLLAQAELALGQRDIALVMFEQSVRQFELAGSSLKADQAQSRAGRLRQPNAADPPLAGTGPRGQAE